MNHPHLATWNPKSKVVHYKKNYQLLTLRPRGKCLVPSFFLFLLYFDWDVGFTLPHSVSPHPGCCTRFPDAYPIDIVMYILIIYIVYERIYKLLGI